MGQANTASNDGASSTCKLQSSSRAVSAAAIRDRAHTGNGPKRRSSKHSSTVASPSRRASFLAVPHPV